jgi:hypothetical protein
MPNKNYRAPKKKPNAKSKKTRQPSAKTKFSTIVPRPLSDDYSKYIRVLKAPFDNPPVRLGGTAVKTGVFSVRQYGTITVAAGTMESNAASTPKSSVTVYVGPFNGEIGLYSTDTVSSAGALSIGQLSQLFTQVPAPTSITSNYATARAIAGGVRLRLVSTTANDQGLSRSYLAPGGNQLNYYSPGSLADMPDTKTGEARHGAQALWHPLDTEDFIFSTNTLTAAMQYNTTSQTTPVAIASFVNLQLPYTVEVETVMHFEGTVNYNSYGLIDDDLGSMTKSHQDDILTQKIPAIRDSSAVQWLRPYYEGINNVLKDRANDLAGGFLRGGGSKSRKPW